MAGPRPDVTLFNILVHILNDTSRHADILREQLDGEPRAAVVQEIERTERNRIDPEELTGLIREGITEGSIAACDPKMTAFALAGALNWIAHWYRDNQTLKPAEIAAAFVDLFNHGLQPRGR